MRILQALDLAQPKIGQHDVQVVRLGLEENVLCANSTRTHMSVLTYPLQAVTREGRPRTRLHIAVDNVDGMQCC